MYGDEYILRLIKRQRITQIYVFFFSDLFTRGMILKFSLIYQSSLIIEYHWGPKLKLDLRGTLFVLNSD